MKSVFFFLKFSITLLLIISGNKNGFAQANRENYLKEFKTKLQKEWPKNRTLNLVFHGHSVPSGYFKTPVVNSLQSYPFLVFKQVKEMYPNAVVNVIITAIGGENSVSGEKRFSEDVNIKYQRDNKLFRFHKLFSLNDIEW